ncbi:uncharacterized protein FA14DRAFT_65136 [Meira miltonrushii]|uniref:RRN7-type domain-containing protein n=1 Tax=Meira miltonrushii TaxID=1280837 RepID=A0A316V8E9_9BASI|nr:uncharacterized protein FA14DRAFT_65136 [Meira miltonrushii]PWN33760.1 hypothetical protein FA14DRAFT_65136 [Meira miltonrushii]
MSSSSYDTGMRGSSSMGGGEGGSSSQRLRKKMARPRCPLCGSRRFRRDPDTSMVVCDQGHVLQGFREETADDGESFDPSQNLSQRTRRRLRVGGNGYVNKKRRSTAIRGTWSAERARYLFYQCLQVILRLQIEAVKEHLPSCPGEDLEAVCRDLWAFYVSMQDKLQPQPYLEASEDAGMQIKGKEKRSISMERAKQAEREAMLQEEEDESQRFDDQLRLLGLAEDGEETDDLVSTDAGETSAVDTDDEGLANGQRSGGDESRRGYVKSGAKNLTTLTCIVYLGLITLRVPIRWNDLRLLLIEQKIPFLHAIYQLPRPMTKALPYRYAERLDGKKVPSIDKLHHVSVRLANDLHNKFSIKFPEMNALPMLWRCTQDLLLPPTVYCAAKRLIAYCEIPLVAVQESCSTLSLDQEKPPQRNRKASLMLDGRLAVSLQYTSVPREVVLMASLILMIKMRYGLDGEERFEEPQIADIWSGCPPLDPWLAALEVQQARGETQFPALADPDSVKIDEMTNDQLDAYLDYAEDKLILEDHPNALHRRHTGKIDDLLACGAGLTSINGRNDIHENGNHDQSDILSQLYKDKKQLYPHLITLNDDQLRPGDAHFVYNRMISSGTAADAQSPWESGWVHDQYAKVLQYAAKAIGIETYILADTVYALEMRLVYLLQDRRTERQKAQQPAKSQKKAERRQSGAQSTEEEQLTDDE